MVQLQANQISPTGPYDLGELLLDDGVVGTPALRFSSGPTTGIYSPSIDNIGFSTNGVKAAQVDGNQSWRFVDGSVGSPTLTFLNDTDTGIFRPTTNQLAIVSNGALAFLVDPTANNFYVGGTLEWQIDSSQLHSTTGQVIRAGNGSAALPTYSFQSDQDTGFYRAAVDQLNISTAGVERFHINSAGLARHTDGTVAFPGISFLTQTTMGLYRSTANLVGLTSTGARGILIDGSNNLQVNDGTAGGPGIRFADDTDTGIYRIASDTIGITAGGVQQASVDTSNFSFIGRVRIADGSEASPSIQFTSDTDTGIYHSAANQVSLSAGGQLALLTDPTACNFYANNSPGSVLRWQIDQTALTAQNSSRIRNSDGTAALPAYSFAGDTNTGVYRPSADILELVAGGTNGLGVNPTTVQIESGHSLLPAVDNAQTNGSAAARWSDVRSVLINGADYGFENGYILREYPATYDDVQTKSADWMKENANLGIQVLNDLGEQVCVIGRDGTVYAKAYKSLEELPA